MEWESQLDNVWHVGSMKCVGGTIHMAIGDLKEIMPMLWRYIFKFDVEISIMPRSENWLFKGLFWWLTTL